MSLASQNNQTVSSDIVSRISPLLDTVEEALAYLSQNEDDELRQGVTETRIQVTSLLEKELKRSLEATISISRLSDEEWLITTRHILDEMSSPLMIQNYYDAEFICIIKQALSNSEDALLEVLKNKLQEIRQRSQQAYDDFKLYFSKYPLWGPLDPESGDYSALEGRVASVKRHAYDFLWLYKRLDDYVSKCTLTSILNNWLNFDLDYPTRMKSCFTDYWDPDIFPNNKDEVLVDVGAFKGDSIADYIHTYGSFYKKIHAYEISPKSVEELDSLIKRANWHDIVVHQKGAGATYDTMFLNEGEVASANSLSTKESGVSVEIVPLDDEVGDEATFIKMDIEGAEQSALLGLEKTISTRHPKLAICTYHGYEDIWKIPVMIDRMYPGYKFYFRHYGENFPPTEFVLLCR
jgi:FkbM family methyltransferase